MDHWKSGRLMRNSRWKLDIYETLLIVSPVPLVLGQLATLGSWPELPCERGGLIEMLEGHDALSHF